MNTIITAITEFIAQNQKSCIIAAIFLIYIGPILAMINLRNKNPHLILGVIEDGPRYKYKSENGFYYEHQLQGCVDHSYIPIVGLIVVIEQIIITAHICRYEWNISNLFTTELKFRVNVDTRERYAYLGWIHKTYWVIGWVIIFIPYKIIKGIRRMILFCIKTITNIMAS
jgi:hypothetical protein